MVALPMAASGIGAKESIEKMGKYFRINGVAAIGDGDEHAVLANGLETNLNDRTLSRVLRGISQQV